MVATPEPPIILSTTVKELLDAMMLANAGGGIGGPPVISAPEGMEASSASPTNTTGSDVTHVNPQFHDFASLLAASQLKQQALFAQHFQNKEAIALPAPQPLFNIGDAATLLQFSQIFQAQQISQQRQFQAAAAVAAQQRAAAAALQQQQHQQQQAAPAQERKRSYPCTFQWCVICQKDVHSSKLPCHIRQCHVAKPMFQCPACDFTSTYSKNNVKSHMVSLHGLAGDPISYMDKYAAQVEEFMKMCFPNVRGRGRPMHGRSSPGSPNSPSSATGARRTSQSSTTNRRASTNPPDAQMAAAAAAFAAAQQQRQAETLMGLNGLNPLMFGAPTSMSSTNNNTMTSNNNSIGATVAVKPGSAIKLEQLDSTSSDPSENVVVSSSANCLDDLLSNVQSNVFHLASNRSGSAASMRSTTANTVRPGENMQPRYLPNRIDCAVLNEEQLTNTVFSRMGPASNLLEKIDISLFEPMEECTQSLLTEAQISAIAEVRESINLQMFEVLYAIHRLDLSLLRAEGVQRVLSIAPSPIDAARFRAYEQSNATNSLGPDEQFILQLSQIERLEEKLHVMLHMATMADKMTQIGQSLSSLLEAARSLQNSSEWQSILQLALAVTNLVSGDFNAHTIKGFVASQIIEYLPYTLPSGHSLLSIMTSSINNGMTDTGRVIDLIPQMEAAAEVSFSSVLCAIHELEECQLRTERELEVGGANQQLAEFLKGAQPQIASLHESLVNTKEEISAVLSYMGEPLPRTGEPFQPEMFFAKIAQFLRALKEQIGGGVEVKDEVV